jgi:hypothetical protein
MCPVQKNRLSLILFRQKLAFIVNMVGNYILCEQNAEILNVTYSYHWEESLLDYIFVDMKENNNSLT